MDIHDEEGPLEEARSHEIPLLIAVGLGHLVLSILPNTNLPRADVLRIVADAHLVLLDVAGAVSIQYPVEVATRPGQADKFLGRQLEDGLLVIKKRTDHGANELEGLPGKEDEIVLQRILQERVRLHVVEFPWQGLVVVEPHRGQSIRVAIW